MKEIAREVKKSEFHKLTSFLQQKLESLWDICTYILLILIMLGQHCFDIRAWADILKGQFILPRSTQSAACSPHPAPRSPQHASRSTQSASRTPQSATRIPQHAVCTPHPAARRKILPKNKTYHYMYNLIWNKFPVLRFY